VERPSHILRQFSERTIFDCTFVEAIENENGRLGLWQTIKKIVSKNVDSEYEYILICEDDHEFTEHYSDWKLLSCINDSGILKADILLGGICFCNKKIEQVHNNLVSVDHFACTQFMVIFRSFFDKILNAQFTEDDCADWKIAGLSNKKLVIHPFISTQKDFGYSDVSSEYYENKMSDYFNETSRVIQNTMKYGIRHNNVSA
jgi:glycosyl transferase family 25